VCVYVYVCECVLDIFTHKHKHMCTHTLHYTTQYAHISVFCFTAEFKDSLGRLKVSCVSNPRQTIDVDMSFEGDVADRPMNSKDIARKRKMQLGTIEKVLKFCQDYHMYHCWLSGINSCQ